jgi:hypothetical protein
MSLACLLHEAEHKQRPYGLRSSFHNAFSLIFILRHFKHYLTKVNICTVKTQQVPQLNNPQLKLRVASRRLVLLKEDLHLCYKAIQILLHLLIARLLHLGHLYGTSHHHRHLHLAHTNMLLDVCSTLQQDTISSLVPCTHTLRMWQQRLLALCVRLPSVIRYCTECMPVARPRPSCTIQCCSGAGMMHSRYPACYDCPHAAKSHARLSPGISPPTLARC